jgi:hypothetical protein
MIPAQQELEDLLVAMSEEEHEALQSLHLLLSVFIPRREAAQKPLAGDYGDIKKRLQTETRSKRNTGTQMNKVCSGGPKRRRKPSRRWWLPR